MVDIKIIASGVCKTCGHNQQAHQDNTVCDVDDCECTAIGSY